MDHEKFNSWGQTQEEDIARPIIGISPENAISVWGTVAIIGGDLAPSLGGRKKLSRKQFSNDLFRRKFYILTPTISDDFYFFSHWPYFVCLFPVSTVSEIWYIQGSFVTVGLRAGTAYRHLFPRQEKNVCVNKLFSVPEIAYLHIKNVFFIFLNVCKYFKMSKNITKCLINTVY